MIGHMKNFGYVGMGVMQGRLPTKNELKKLLDSGIELAEIAAVFSVSVDVLENILGD